MGGTQEVIAAAAPGAARTTAEREGEGMGEMNRPRHAPLAAETLCGAFQVVVADRPHQLAHRAFGGGPGFTYAEFAARVRRLADGLHSLGVRRGDTVAEMLTNRPEFNLVDVAALHLGAIGFSVYNTLSPEQIQHLFRNSGTRVVVTERQFLSRVLEARTPDIEHIVLVDAAERGLLTLDDLERSHVRGFDFESAWRAVEPEDVATLIYTSGTTGPPKAVQLTHASVLFECRALEEVVNSEPGGRVISYLPVAHVGDRLGSHYGASICYGRTVVSVVDPRQIAAAMVEVRPTVFGGVPRVWEKLKGGLEAAGLRDPAQLPEAGKALVRARLGLDQCVLCVSGAAPAAMEVLQYFHDLGLPVNEGWGMSELSCFATVNPPAGLRMGTVGKALPGVELRLLDDGELLVRGPLVMKGYRDDPERTAEALDAGGWLHTGDIATIDADGYVRIVDRKKELIINAAGKNMSPANIELRLRAASPLIAQAVCIGDRRPYNVALLVLDREVLSRTSGGSSLSQEALHGVIAAAVEAANAGLSRVEQVKRFAILDAEWLPGGDELTPTMKLKRKPIHAKYAAEIERLYG
jgi:long-chain acyl-CoA synthetase